MSLPALLIWRLRRAIGIVPDAPFGGLAIGLLEVTRPVAACSSPNVWMGWSASHAVTDVSRQVATSGAARWDQRDRDQ